jgi:sialic acid synthase SpsE
MRPGVGISPMKINEFIGKQLAKHVSAHELLTENCVE